MMEFMHHPVQDSVGVKTLNLEHDFFAFAEEA
jgi:hypothetical protein